MKCGYHRGCENQNAIHYVGGGIWLCFEHFLSLFLGRRK
jgi:hypothetical protein